jgi:uncharacterized protein
MIDLSIIREYAQNFYAPDDLHGIGHIQRVLSHAKLIHQNEGGFWELIESIIWLHDIGRKYEKEQNRNHALISADIAKDWLQKSEIPTQYHDLIIEGIQAHSFSLKIPPKTIEAMIVSDADKLDALGAIGIFRTCAFQALHQEGINSILEHIDEKLLLLEQQMFLPSSKKLARERTERLLVFKKELLEELNR